MLKVPFYSLENYQKILGRKYEEQSLDDWVSFFDLIAVLGKSFLSEYGELDTRKLSSVNKYSQFS